MSTHALHYFVSLYLTAMTTFGLALFVWLQHTSQPLHKAFVRYCLAIGMWSLLQAAMVQVRHPETSLVLSRMLFVAVMLIPASFLHFVLCFLGKPAMERTVRTNYVVCLVFLLMIPLPQFIRGVSFRPYLGGFFDDPGPLFILHFVWFLGVATFALMMMWYEMWRASGAKRNQLLYLVIGTTLGYCGGLPNYLYNYDKPLPILNPFGTYAVPLYVAMATYAIVKHQLMDIRIIIKSSLVYSILIGAITAAYLTMVIVMEKCFQGFLGYRSLVATAVASFLIAIFFNPVRDQIQKVVDRALFKATPTELAEQRERLLEEVRKGDQMKAVAQLAAGLAHEIKNPLASIKTFTDFLDQRYADPEFRAKFTKIVGGEVQRIQLITQRLLEFAKPSRPNLTPLEVSQVIDETVESLSNELLQRHIDVVRDYAAGVQIMGDAKQLKQVFLNLLLNSLQAVNGAGRIKIETSLENTGLMVTIADNGCGIAPNDLYRIFEPFFTTKPAGTGLGLSVVQGIMAEHGGQIEIDSRVGNGTVARLRFPIRC